MSHQKLKGVGTGFSNSILVIADSVTYCMRQDRYTSIQYCVGVRDFKRCFEHDITRIAKYLLDWCWNLLCKADRM
jgi:hypothetical protein